MISFAVISADWQFQLDCSPRGESHLLGTPEHGSVFLLPLGSSGLGAWTGRGTMLEGFPVSSDYGVIMRPAAVETPDGLRIVYADNNVRLHMVDLNGREAPGWPVEHPCNVVTGITVVDLDEDGAMEIAYGTGDGKLHLRNTWGGTIEGFPIDLDSRLQCQPTSASLGGGRGNGLVCTTNNSQLFLLDSQGNQLPGWPRQLPYPSGTIPVTGDLNGDGQTDIVVATQDGKVHLFSLLGDEQEGWPFRLDERPVPGAPSLGVLDPESHSPQLAIASVDSLVYLINGDGTLAGTWRWPDKIDSRPWQPVICFTDQGPAVVTASHAGTIYAWDSTGRLMNGFPVRTGLGCIVPPLIADLDGDRSRELLTVTPTGLVQATRMVSGSPAGCYWPQALRDQYNSGSYTSESHPSVTVDRISGEFSGPVTVTYSTSGPGITGISVSYSTDSGFTWTETENYTSSGNSVTWLSHLDLPTEDLRNCMLKITPHMMVGLGESGTSGLIHIDNNQPPVIRLENPEIQPDGSYRLGYTLQDREGDIVHLQARYSTDDGTTWNIMHLQGSTLEIEPWFYGDPVFWNPAEDPGAADIEEVAFRIRALDADPGPWFRFDGLSVSMECLPTPQIIAPADEVTGEVEFGVRLSSGSRDPMDFVYQYTVDQGERWHDAALIDCQESLRESDDYILTWASEQDLPEMDCENVQLRSLPPPGECGVSVPSSTFHLDNNSPPYCRIESPERYDIFRGMVPVTFTVVDSEWDDILLELQYRLHGRESTWHSAMGLMNDRLIDASMYSTTLNWNSSVDLPGTLPLEIELRLMASDRDSSWSQEVGPLTISNRDIPEIMSATLSAVNPASRTVGIAFEAADENDRRLGLEVHFSTDDGKTWREATLSSGGSGLVPGAYSGNVVWNYGSDELEGFEETLLRLTPVYDGGKPGRPRFIQQVFR